MRLPLSAVLHTRYTPRSAARFSPSLHCPVLPQFIAKVDCRRDSFFRPSATQQSKRAPSLPFSTRLFLSLFENDSIDPSRKYVPFCDGSSLDRYQSQLDQCTCFYFGEEYRTGNQNSYFTPHFSRRPDRRQRSDRKRGASYIVAH